MWPLILDACLFLLHCLPTLPGEPTWKIADVHKKNADAQNMCMHKLSVLYVVLVASARQNPVKTKLYISGHDWRDFEKQMSPTH